MTPEQLKKDRLYLSLTQEGLAKAIGIPPNRGMSVSRWERAEVPFPGPVGVLMDLWVRGVPPDGKALPWALKWRSVDRPPKDKRAVPVYHPDFGWTKAHMLDGVWCDSEGPLPVQPTHWMPLPEPPQEEGK